MWEIEDIMAVFKAFEKLVDNHPYLEKEVQSLYEEEVKERRIKFLERGLSLKT